MHPEPDESIHLAAPLAVWKLFLLLLLTLGTYYFVWLYRISSDLKAKGLLTGDPRAWALSPLLGPAMALPAHRLATRLEEWRASESREFGHFSDPTFVTVLSIVAYLLLLIEFLANGDLASGLVLSFLAQTTIALILQGQLNINKGRSYEFHTPAWRLERFQLGMAGVGSLLAVPFYFFYLGSAVFFGGNSISPGTVVFSDDERVGIRISDKGWSRVDADDMQEFSEIELAGPTSDTWAVVYDVSNSTLNDTLLNRQSMIEDDLQSPSCRQSKMLQEDGWLVIGQMTCEGRSPFTGNYLFESRVVRDENAIYEIVVHTQTTSKDELAELSRLVRTLADSLEVYSL